MKNAYLEISREPLIVWSGVELVSRRLDAAAYSPDRMRACRLVQSSPSPTELGAAGQIVRRRGKKRSVKTRAFVSILHVDDWGLVDWDSAESHWPISTGIPVRAGEVLYSKINPGKTRAAVVPSNMTDEVLCSSEFAVLKVGEEHNPYYIGVALQTEIATTQAVALTQGTSSSRRRISDDDVEDLLIMVPSRPLQDYVGAKAKLAERCRQRARELQKQVDRHLEALYAGAPLEERPSIHYWVGPDELDSPRLDAWHYQPHFRDVVTWCRQSGRFEVVATLAYLSGDRWQASEHSGVRFNYIEISGVDTTTGQVTGNLLPTVDAPGRARKLVKGNDILVSTVRPNRKAVALTSDSMNDSVASTGFAVLRAFHKSDAGFVQACLRHDVSTAQLMRWNTGAMYPAVDEEIPLGVYIPILDPETRRHLGSKVEGCLRLLDSAAKLIVEAKGDTEALIRGRLKMEDIESPNLATVLQRSHSDLFEELGLTATEVLSEMVSTRVGQRGESVKGK